MIAPAHIALGVNNGDRKEVNIEERWGAAVACSQRRGY